MTTRDDSLKDSLGTQAASRTLTERGQLGRTPRGDQIEGDQGCSNVRTRSLAHPSNVIMRTPDLGHAIPCQRRGPSQSNAPKASCSSRLPTLMVAFGKPCSTASELGLRPHTDSQAVSVPAAVAASSDGDSHRALEPTWPHASDFAFSHIADTPHTVPRALRSGSTKSKKVGYPCRRHYRDWANLRPASVSFHGCPAQPVRPPSTVRSRAFGALADQGFSVHLRLREPPGLSARDRGKRGSETYSQ